MMMWTLPQRVVLTAGFGFGSTPLRAFDAALLDACIGDFNLVRVSSIVPVGAEVCYMEDGGKEYIAQLIKGTIVPVVYSMTASDKAGVTVAAALAVGIPQDRRRNGVIFEAGVVGDKRTAEEQTRRMAEEALLARGYGPFEIMVVSTQTVIDHGAGCAISAAVLLP